MSFITPSSSLTVYDTSLAAAAIHSQITDRVNSTALKEICQLASVEDEFVVNFIVEADMSKTGGTTTHAGGQLYHAALAHFKVISAENSIGKKFDITVQMSSYVDGEYQHAVDTEDTTPQIEADSSTTSHNTSFAGSMINTATTVQSRLANYPFVDPEHANWLETKAYAKDTTPTATRVAQLLNRTFAKGIPLPADQRVLRAIYEVHTHSPLHQTVEHITMCRIRRGVIRDNCYMPYEISSNFSFSWGFQSSKKTGYVNMKKNFDRNVGVVLGFEKPTQIPDSAVAKRSAIMTVDLEPTTQAISNSSNKAQLENIKSTHVEELD
jgi:hypothetical protein